MSTTTFASALQEWCSPGSLTIVTNAGLICFGACFNDVHFSSLDAYFPRGSELLWRVESPQSLLHREIAINGARASLLS